MQRVEKNISEQSEKLDDVLQAIKSLRPIQVGKLALPLPVPEKHIDDWRTAMLDASDASEVNQVDTEKMSQLLETIEEPNALVNLVQQGKVTVVNLVLTNPHPSKQKTKDAKYTADVIVRNNTADTTTVFLPHGQVFENVEPHSGYQNLVAASTVERSLPPSVSVTISVPGYCFNRHQKAPIGQVANISPLKVRFNFHNQKTLWDGTKNIMKPQQPK